MIFCLMLLTEIFHHDFFCSYSEVSPASFSDVKFMFTFKRIDIYPSTCTFTENKGMKQRDDQGFHKIVLNFFFL